MFQVLRLLFTLRVSVVVNKQIKKNRIIIFILERKIKYETWIFSLTSVIVGMFSRMRKSILLLTPQLKSSWMSPLKRLSRKRMNNQQVSCILFSILNVSTFLFTAIVLTTRDSPWCGGKRNRTKGVDWSNIWHFRIWSWNPRSCICFATGVNLPENPGSRDLYTSNIYVPAGSDHSDNDTELMNKMILE